MSRPRFSPKGMGARCEELFESRDLAFGTISSTEGHFAVARFAPRAGRVVLGNNPIDRQVVLFGDRAFDNQGQSMAGQTYGYAISEVPPEIAEWAGYPGGQRAVPMFITVGTAVEVGVVPAAKLSGGLTEEDLLARVAYSDDRIFSPQSRLIEVIGTAHLSAIEYASRILVQAPDLNVGLTVSRAMPTKR